jgi:phosphoglycerol transferase MdoB-like AlkP superfamily enzyme
MANRTGFRFLLHFLLIIGGSLLLTMVVLPPDKTLWTNPTLVLTNLLPILALVLVIYCIFGRVFSALGLVALLTVGIRYLHDEKRAVLEIPLTVSDALLSGQILASPGLVFGYMGWSIIFGSCLSILIVLVLLYKETPIAPIRYRLVLLVAFLALLPLRSPISQRYIDLPQAPWEPDPSLRKVGIAAYLIQDYLLTSALETPVANVETLTATRALYTLPATEPASNQHPDIVLWLGESFFDPRILQDIDTCDQTPAFCALALANASGSLTVPTYGGQTIRTEFEVLTGVPMAVVAKHEYPYMSLTNAPVNSIAWELQDQGYRTTAIHNHLRAFWRRPVAMKNLGFQRWIGVEDFKVKKKAGIFHADSMLTDAVIKLLEEPAQNAPQLIFAISMQAHGPHGYQTNLPDEQVKAIAVPDKLKPQHYSILQQFFYHLNSADTELERIYTYIKSRKRPTLVMFFGDHLPGLGPVFEDLEFENGLGPRQQKTPFLLLANYSLNKLDIPTMDLATWQLSTLLLKAADLLDDGAFAWFNLLYDQVDWSTETTLECKTTNCEALLQFQFQQLAGPSVTPSATKPTDIAHPKTEISENE